MAQQANHQPILSIAALRAGYGPGVVLDDVNLAVRQGEWCTLLGSNGVGKSTLLHCVVGQMTLLTGEVLINGHSMKHARIEALRNLGFACQPEKLPGLLTGRQCLEVYAAAKGIHSVGQQLHDLAAALKFVPYLDQYVDTYSLGTRQKLSVLLALLGNPPLLVLDEAFNGLDPASSLILKRHLRAEVTAGRCSVLLATHALDIVEHFSDKAALLLDGHIVRTWDQNELRMIRDGQPDALEIELAAASDLSPRGR